MIASIFVLWKKLCDVDSRGMFELLYDLFFNEDFNILT